METKVVCPACKGVQPGIIKRDGAIYAIDGVEVLGYRCPNCDQIVHWRKPNAKKKGVRRG